MSSVNDMLRLIDAYASTIRQTETKIAEAQQAKKALEEQVLVESAKRDLVQVDKDSQTSTLASLVAERSRLDNDIEQVRSCNAAMKQDIANNIKEYDALMTAERQEKEEFCMNCMNLDKMGRELNQ